MARILGISAYYHDSAACYLEHGKIVAAVQEERFSRRKHDPAFPLQAIEYCLTAGNIDIEELDAIVFYDKPMLKFERLLETYLYHAPRGLRSFLRSMPIWLKEKLYLKSVLKRELSALLPRKNGDLPKLLFTQHHQAHAASAFYASPFEEATVLCLDGVGEWVTTSIWHGRDKTLEPQQEIHFPHSIGLLYSAFTYYCGFKVNSGEYKLMGLAPYGEPEFVDLIEKELIDIREDGSFQLNLRYFDYPVGQVMTNRHFDKLFGVSRRTEEAPMTQHYMNMARSIQVVTERLVLAIAKHAVSISGSRHLCLAGGVALNCVANGVLLRSKEFDDIWIQPAAGDAGGALGAALLAENEYFSDKHDASESATPMQKASNLMQGTYLGPEFSNVEIKKILQDADLSFDELPFAELPFADYPSNNSIRRWQNG